VDTGALLLPLVQGHPQTQARWHADQTRAASQSACLHAHQACVTEHVLARKRGSASRRKGTQHGLCAPLLGELQTESFMHRAMHTSVPAYSKLASKSRTVRGASVRCTSPARRLFPFGDSFSDECLAHVSRTISAALGSSRTGSNAAACDSTAVKHSCSSLPCVSTSQTQTVCSARS
jgi:hypothetical protein